MCRGRPPPPLTQTAPSPNRPPADLEWKLTYVGSAESEKYDQVLDTVFVGPVAPGQYRFVFQVRRRRVGWERGQGRGGYPGAGGSRFPGAAGQEGLPDGGAARQGRRLRAAPALSLCGRPPPAPDSTPPAASPNFKTPPQPPNPPQNPPPPGGPARVFEDPARRRRRRHRHPADLLLQGPGGLRGGGPRGAAWGAARGRCCLRGRLQPAMTARAPESRCCVREQLKPAPTQRKLPRKKKKPPVFLR